MFVSGLCSGVEGSSRGRPNQTAAPATAAISPDLRSYCAGQVAVLARRGPAI